jgi:hypothetical protein
VQIAFHRAHLDLHMTSSGVGESVLVGVPDQLAQDDAQLDRCILIRFDAMVGVTSWLTVRLLGAWSSASAFTRSSKKEERSTLRRSFKP